MTAATAATARRSPRHRRAGWRLARTSLVATPLVVALVLGAAVAYWSTTSAPGGHGASGSATVDQGQTPIATVEAGGVAVGWAPSTLSSDDAVDGYLVRRYDATTLTVQTILSACTGTVAATTCVEDSVPVGEWVYSVTPVVGTSWQGAESTRSAPVVVGQVTPLAVADSRTTAEDTPLAVADSRTTAEDTLLAVAAPGVLANDTGTGTLTAILVSGVAHGTLTLHAGGGFEYGPEPDHAGTDSFTYKVSNGTLSSPVVAVTLTVTAVNDAPVNQVPGAQPTPENTNRVFSSANGNPIAIGDVDAGLATVEVQLTATNGTITLPVLTGLTFTAGDGTADATMTFRASTATIDLRLNGTAFTPTTGFTGAAALQVIVRDLGNVGTGGTLTDTDSVAIAVDGLGIFTAHQDIGVPPGPTGSSSYTAGTYTVAGSGADIWDNADHFQFASVPMTGDGRLTARVISQVQSPAPASAPAKAGVMFRETLAAGSIHGMADIMRANGSEFHWRLTTDGPSAATTVTAGIAAPYWVRITRVGNLVTAERSVNGTTWVPQGSSQTITMGSTIYAGLAVTAHDTTKLNTATFDNVSLVTTPTAAADTSYSVNEETTLDVAAPGVLANDTDLDASPLTAVLVSGTTGLTLDADGSFAYVPPANVTGPVTFTYRASNGVFDSAAVTVTITIRPVNETPGFTMGADQIVQAGSSAQTVVGWATAISPGTGESGQLVTFTATNDANALFAVQPAISATGTLTYTPSTTIGTATVTVSLRDDGGTTNGATDTSAAQTFTISITGDVDGPTGGSVDATGLVGTGSRHASSLTLSIALAKGTDPSGVAATGAALTRATATLTSTAGADGPCGALGPQRR